MEDGFSVLAAKYNRAAEMIDEGDLEEAKAAFRELADESFRDSLYWWAYLELMQPRQTKYTSEAEKLIENWLIENPERSEMRERLAYFQDVVKCDFYSALNNYKILADYGLWEYNYRIGRLIEKTEDNASSALEYYKKSAENGHLFSKLQISRLYSGNSVFSKLKYLFRRLVTTPLYLIVYGITSRDRRLTHR